jgi:prolyl oligopeptidase
MKTFTLVLSLSLLALSSNGAWEYPATKVVDASDTYFGKTIKDPYRWLETSGEQEVQGWFKTQAELADRLLQRIPSREALAKEWMELDKLKPASYEGISYENRRVFYKKTLGGENVGKLFVRKGWNGKERLLFDPNAYKPGVVTTIQSFLPSWDGKYVVMGLSSGGAEYSELRVLGVAGAVLLPESVYPSFGPWAWMKDSKSFLYDAGKVTDIKSLEIELNRKTRLHRVGTDFLLTSISSATKATRNWELRRRSSPSLLWMSPILIMCSELLPPCSRSFGCSMRQFRS